MTKITKEQIEQEIVRAEMCAEATYPGEFVRELLRLARLGLLLKQYRGTVMNSLTKVLSELPKELTGPERELYKQLLAMKEAQ